VKDQKKKEIKDEPGAEDRFKRGIANALNTPPKPFTPKPKKAAAKKPKSDAR
jgi:hypothetical protein